MVFEPIEKNWINKFKIVIFFEIAKKMYSHIIYYVSVNTYINKTNPCSLSNHFLWWLIQLFIKQSSAERYYNQSFNANKYRFAYVLFRIHLKPELNKPKKKIFWTYHTVSHIKRSLFTPFLYENGRWMGEWKYGMKKFAKSHGESSNYSFVSLQTNLTIVQVEIIN